MEDLVRYRAMESLCRQSAVFRPLESWRLLAEAEMWHHKALETTKRWKKSRAARSNAMRPRRPAHSLIQRRFPMRAMEADCRRVELFAKAVELGGSIALKRGGTRLSLSRLS